MSAAAAEPAHPRARGTRRRPTAAAHLAEGGADAARAPAAARGAGAARPRGPRVRPARRARPTRSCTSCGWGSRPTSRRRSSARSSPRVARSTPGAEVDIDAGPPAAARTGAAGRAGWRWRCCGSRRAGPARRGLAPAAAGRAGPGGLSARRRRYRRGVRSRRPRARAVPPRAGARALRRAGRRPAGARASRRRRSARRTGSRSRLGSSTPAAPSRSPTARRRTRQGWRGARWRDLPLWLRVSLARAPGSHGGALDETLARLIADADGWRLAETPAREPPAPAARLGDAGVSELRSRAEARLRRVFSAAGVRGWLHACDVDDPGRSVELDGGHRVPLASTFKLHVAVAALRTIDAGEVEGARDGPRRGAPDGRADRAGRDARPGPDERARPACT